MREQNPLTLKKTQPHLFPQRCGNKIPFTLKKITAPKICSRNAAGTNIYTAEKIQI
jgi:hypothetical protein